MSVRVGNISDVSGNVNVAGGDITTHHTVTGLSAEQIRKLFLDIYRDIYGLSAVSPANKVDLKAKVKEIQSTVIEASQKNENVAEGFLSRRLSNIARMAPGVFDLAVTILANPLAGLGMAVRKIAEKAKEETTK